MSVVKIVVTAGIGENIHFAYPCTAHILVEQEQKACANAAAPVRLVHHEKDQFAVKGGGAVFQQGVICFIETLEQIIAIPAILRQSKQQTDSGLACFKLPGKKRLLRAHGAGAGRIATARLQGKGAVCRKGAACRTGAGRIAAPRLHGRLAARHTETGIAAAHNDADDPSVQGGDVGAALLA